MVTIDINEVDSERRIVEGSIEWVDTDYVETEILEEDGDLMGTKTQIVRTKNIVSVVHSLHCGYCSSLDSSMENED